MNSLIFFIILFVLNDCCIVCLSDASTKNQQIESFSQIPSSKKPSSNPSSISVKSLKPTSSINSQSQLQASLKSSIKPTLKTTFKSTERPSLKPTTIKPNTNPIVPIQKFKYFSTAGNQIVNSFGNNVRFIGINWYGFETQDAVVGGLNYRSYKSILDQIKSNGFNIIRIPFCNAMLIMTSTINKRIDYKINSDLVNLTPLQVLDKIIYYAGSIGLRIMLDRHSALPGNFANECQVFISGNSYYTLDRFFSDWVMLAKRYANTAVIAADLWNEPHVTVGGKQCTSWHGDITTDYGWFMTQAANKILAANPDWLIVIEGFYDDCGLGQEGWWGSEFNCLRAIGPIRISNMKKLVYSTHEYSCDVGGKSVNGVWNTQPWFSDRSFPANMPSVWYDHFGFIFQNAMAPVIVGEYGFKLNNPVNPSCEATKIPWMLAFMKYMNGYVKLDNNNILKPGQLGMGSFLWALGSSHDLSGFLLSDWKTVNPVTLKYLQPLLSTSKLLD